MLPLLLSGAEAHNRHQALRDPATGGTSQIFGVQTHAVQTRGAPPRHQPG